MSKHENHQFMEIGKGKTEGKMMYKDVMCPECGMRKRMHEDGRMEEMKSEMSGSHENMEKKHKE